MKAGEYLRRRRSLEAPPERLFGGPRRWLAGDRVLETALRELACLGRSPVFFGEAALWRVIAPRLVRRGTEPPLFLEFPRDGECSRKNIDSLVRRLKARRATGLAAFGGGKALDTAKLAACQLSLPLATFPGSAATCACATAVAVEHGENGEYLKVVDLPRAPDICLVDFTWLAEAPDRYLRAGMADTLAKWLELKALGFEGTGEFGGATGTALARQAFEVVRRDGPESLDEPSGPAWRRVVEANLLLSAQASNLGGGLAAAAHSLANGLTTLPGLRTWLHGEQVGLGLLFQDRLMEHLGLDLPEIQGIGDREKLLARLGLPVRVPKGLMKGAALARVTEKTVAPGETVHLLPGADKLPNAIFTGLIRQLCG